MTWASDHISRLKQGETVTFRARGRSMAGKIADGAMVTVVPIDRPLKAGDVVLCRVHGADYLHLVKGMRKKNEKSPGQFQIGNNRGGINGWTSRDKIYGLYLTPEEVAKREAKKAPTPEAGTEDAEASAG